MRRNERLAVDVTKGPSAKTRLLGELQAIAPVRDPMPDRRRAFVKIAHDLACELSLDGYSMRRVADRCGISLAALQYHFENKGRLIAEVIRFRTDWYSSCIYNCVAGSSDEPGTIFDGVVEWLLADAAVLTTANFSYNVWALSQHDDLASAALSEYRRLYDALLVTLVRLVNPSVQDHAAETAAVLIASLIDGTMPLVSRGRAEKDVDAGAKAAVQRLAHSIALDAT